MDANSGFELFLYWLKHGEGMSDLTIRVATYELNAWSLWLKQRSKDIMGAASDDVHQWIASHLDRKLARSTIDKKTWVVRRFYSWAHRERLISSNPWQAISSPSRKHEWQPRYTPTKESMDRLLRLPDACTALGVRDRTLMELLYATGLRAAELLSLQVWQVPTDRLQARAIHVVGKGGRERLVVFGERARAWLRYYAVIARPELMMGRGQASQFFVHPRGTSHRMSHDTLSSIVRKYAAMAEMPLMTPHSFRHAFATHLYQGGADLRTIQMLLGHACLTTTCVYAKTSPELLRQLLETHHPRGKNYSPQSLLRWADAASTDLHPPPAGRHSFLTEQDSRPFRWLTAAR